MTLKTFQKCENKYDWYAYVRIGLYLVNKRGERVNFCDVHLGGLPAKDGDMLIQGVFSGPKDSVKQINRLERSKEAKQRYFLDGKVHSDLDISAGGIARLIFGKVNTNRRDLYIWLLGPLLFEGTAYGSLVCQLSGWVSPKATHQWTGKIDYAEPGDIEGMKREDEQRTDPKNQRYKLVIPKGFGGKYLPCKLWGSDYSEGTRPRSPDRAEKTAPSMESALTAAKKRMNAAVLPVNTIRALWKVVDYADELTVCETFARSG
jgi:hypothetical protein